MEDMGSFSLATVDPSMLLAKKYDHDHLSSDMHPMVIMAYFIVVHLKFDDCSYKCFVEPAV